jgi:hypothetical protein
MNYYKDNKNDRPDLPKLKILCGNLSTDVARRTFAALRMKCP